MRDRVEPVAAAARENAESVPVVPLRLLDEIAIHGCPRGEGPLGTPYHAY